MDTIKAYLPKPSTLKRNFRKAAPQSQSSSALSSGADTYGLTKGGGDTKVQTLLTQWKKLDENLSSFERLESMRMLVAKGEMTSGAYDMLHDLAVSRATGKARKPSVMGVTALEMPIMAGYLYLRVGKSWKKRYVLLFTERLEYHGSKQESESNRGLTSTPTSLLVLTERFFVSDSASRRLTNSREHGFMVSDFVTTHYFAADSQDLAQYWMHILAKTIRKIQEAKAFFESRPKIIGHTPKSSETLEKEYQDRLSSYQSSQRQTSREGKSDASTPGRGDRRKSAKVPELRDPAALAEMRKSNRQSIRLKAEAEDLETKLMEHAVLQVEFEKEATKAEEDAAKIQKEIEEIPATAPTETIEEKKAMLADIEARRVELEERALLEAKMVVEYEELVEEKNMDAAEALAKEEVQIEIKRRSVALIPVNTPVDQLEKILQEKLNDVESPEQLELQTVAIEAVARRAEEEQEEKAKEAEEAYRIAKEKHREAEEAQAAVHVDESSMDEAMAKVQIDQEAQWAAERAAIERNQAIMKVEALQRLVVDSKEALERSKQRAESKMGKKPSITKMRGPVGSMTYRPPKTEEPHIQAQIERLVAIIKQNGALMQDGCRQMAFGKLCKAYETEIAETVESRLARANSDADTVPVVFDIVGLLVRGKRQQLLDYDGGNLFRGKDDLVIVKTMVVI